MFESLKPLEEKKKLLKTLFDDLTLLMIGKEVGDEYSKGFSEQGYDVNYKRFDADQVASNVAAKASDLQLMEFSVKYSNKLQTYRSFFGYFYTYFADKKQLKIGNEWNLIKSRLEEIYKKHGKTAYGTLKACYEVYSVQNKKWDNYLFIQSVAAEIGGKGWRKTLTEMEMAWIVDRHKGDVRIPEELSPLVKKTLEEWEKRPVPLALESIKISRHEALQKLVEAYPHQILGEKLTLLKTDLKLSDGDEIDIVFIDSSGNHVIVDIKTNYEESAVGQLLRYKEKYSGERQVDAQKIRMAIACSKEIDQKFVDVVKGVGIELYQIAISAKKL